MGEQGQHRTRQSIAAARASAVAVVTAAMLLSAACSSSKATSRSTPSNPVPGTAAAINAAPTAAAGSPPEIVDIEASEWSYRISGSPHAGLVEIHFDNLGNVAHEVGLVRTKDGVTLDQVKTALKQGEAAAQALQASPGQDLASAAIAGPQVNEHVVVPLVAGHYVITSFLPVSGGQSQVDKGLIGEFTVLAAKAGAVTPPATDGTVTLTDSAITVPANFGHGGTFAVRNTGTKVHDFSVAKLAGKPLSDFFQCVAQSFGTGSAIDSCPGSLQGGVTTLQPGGTAYLTVVFGPGQFGYVSTQGDGADFRAGLNGTFTNS